VIQHEPGKPPAIAPITPVSCPSRGPYQPA